MSDNLSINWRSHATSATFCASRSTEKTALSKRSLSAIARLTFWCAASKKC